jgi:hypothetical protein
MSKDRDGQSVGALSPKKCGGLSYNVWYVKKCLSGETWGAFAAGKLQKIVC